MTNEIIKIKYNNEILDFVYVEKGKGYKNDKYREMWYYTEDGALFIWSMKGHWRRINKKEFEVIKND